MGEQGPERSFMAVLTGLREEIKYMDNRGLTRWLIYTLESKEKPTVG